jgi:hypothetical protein
MSLSPNLALARPWVQAEPLARYGLVTVCAASAGLHAALVPEHLDEGGPLLAGAFALSAVLLAIAAGAVRAPRNDTWAPAFCLVVLLGVVVAFVMSRTTGIPVLMSEVEPLDVLGVATTAAEIVGAGLAVLLLPRREHS